MWVIATISDTKRLALVVDVESGETVTIPVRPEFIDQTIAGRPPCRPFGITWTADELFIVNNRQLLVFDDQLEYARTSEVRLQVNMHQLAYRAGYIWAVSPWTNSLIGVSPTPGDPPVEFGLVTQRLGPYLAHEGKEDDDRFHFNSLLWGSNCLFVAAHAFGAPSFIARYELPELRLSTVRHDAGSSVHGVAVDGDELFWISSGTGEIRSDRGFCFPLTRAGYGRGLAVTNEHLIVAVSERRSRGERHAGDSWIQVIDRRGGSLVTEVYLAETGSVNDLRLLDGHDYAHGVDLLRSFTMA